MAGRWRFVATKTVRGPHVAVGAFPFVCGACGAYFISARELVEHMREARNNAA